MPLVTDFWRRQDAHILQSVEAAFKETPRNKSVEENLRARASLVANLERLDRTMQQLPDHDREVVSLVMTREMELLVLALTKETMDRVIRHLKQAA